MNAFKQLLGVYLVAFVIISCNRTQNKDTDTAETSVAEITFKEQSFDFGDMDEGDIVEHDFEFTNTGSAPLEILDVHVQCGCTVASRPQELIGVGQSDKITVRFNSTGKPGVNKKFVTVLTNAKKPSEPIAFTATVAPALKNNI